MSIVSAMARNRTTALQRLRQNHKRMQEVDLLCSLVYTIIVSMFTVGILRK
jgi:hypothetical protein